MKLKTTIKETREIEMDIEFPYYCKDAMYYYKVVDEKSVIVVYNDSPESARVGVQAFWIKSDEIAVATPVDASEYEMAFLEALDRVIEANEDETIKREYVKDDLGRY